jgi:hypothetical protein
VPSMSDELEARIDILPGHGIGKVDRHAADMIFALRGPKGAVTCAFYTDWYTLPAQEAALYDGIKRVQPTADEFVFHSPRMTADTSKTPETGCMYVTGGLCYHYTSVKTAEYLRDILLAEGSDGVWREMATRYRSATGSIGNMKP